jgi:ATP-binding cassette, subfamily B (MDR/TAP), member 1
MPPASFISLFRYADSYDMFLFAISLVCAAGTGVVIPLLSLILGKLLNGTSTALLEDVVNTASLHMTLLSFGALITLGGGIYVAFISAQRQVHKLRLAYLRALLRQDIGFSDTHSLPELAARLTEDTLTVQAGLGDKLFLILTGIAQFIGSLVLAFTVAAQAWRLALTLLVTLPVAIAAVGFLFTFVTSMSGESDDAYARAGEVLTESLSMIRTVAALGGEEHEAARYDVHLATAEKIGRKKGLVSGVGQGIFVGVMCSVYAIGLYAGSRFIELNRSEYPECIENPEASYNCFSGGTVIQVLFAVIGGAFSLGIVAPNISYVGSAQAAASRMFAVIDANPAVDAFSDEGLAPTSPATGRVEFRNVTFKYPSRPDEIILNDFSLRIEPGQKVALVGPSGSGKSTIIALLQRWYEPFSGEILLDGIDLRKYNVKWLRSQQALVGQEPQLLPMSIRDNIAAGIPTSTRSSKFSSVVVVVVNPQDNGVKENAVEDAAKVADAHTFISTLPKGYDTLVTSAQLSGGQKQRVCIARAMIRKAPILLLDEATSALDSRSEKSVQAAIDKLLSSTSTSSFTSISIAHRLSTITSSDVIVVIEKGKLIEKGTHKELISKGQEESLYARLWALQNRSKSVASDLNTKNEKELLTTRAVKEDEEQEQITKEVEVITESLLESSSISTFSSSSTSWAPVPTVPYKKAWEYQSPEALWVALGILLATINGLLLPAFAYLLTRFVVIFYDPDTSKMISQATMYLAIFFGIAGVCFFLNILQGYAFASAGEPFVRRLRRAAYSSIITQSIGFLELPTNSPGQLSARLGLEATKMKLSLGPRLGEKVSALSTLISGIGLAFWANWQLALLVILIGPLVVYAADAENQVTYSSTDVVKQAYAEAGAVAWDAVAAIRVVHSFALQGVTLNRFEEALKTPFAQGYRRAIGLGLGFGSNQCLQNLVAAVVFKAGLTLQVQGIVTPDKTFLVFFAFTFACFGLPQLTALLSDAAGIRDALKSFFSMILRSSDIDGREMTAETWKLEKTEKDKKENDDKNSLASHLAVPEGRIEFVDVRFSYPTRPESEVLCGLSLSVAPGMTVALVGPSGSGKSSIVSLLLRLYSPSSGKILVDGCDITSLPARAIRDATGWVGQEAPLFAESIAYNIAYGRAGGSKNKPIPDAGMPREAAPDAPLPLGFVVPEDVQTAAEEANAHSFIKGFRHGFATNVGDGGRGVSGGQKQRLACARAIVRKGNLRLLLLDEATSALDSESEKIVQESIDKLLKEQSGKVTTFIVAHRLSTIINSDLIVVIDKGQVVEKGTFRELMKGDGIGLFRKLAQAQGFESGSIQTMENIKKEV